MKTKVKFKINLVEWNLLPVYWDFNKSELGIWKKEYSFLCFTLILIKLNDNT
jgi:hypothetical protein